jgi:Rha family phage regulatory protein
MDLVKIEGGQVLADSLTVATAFGKQHYNVIRDIEILIANMKALGENEIEGKITLLNFEGGYSDQQIQRFFIESKYYHPKNKQEHKMYLMTRDGFSLLVMGFTGQKALEWKLKYIEAFNYMEESLMKVKELDITDSQEWKMLKGSAKSIVHIDNKLKDKMKEIEKILRSIEDDRFHIQIYGDQVLKMVDRVEQGKLRDKNEY